MPNEKLWYKKSVPTLVSEKDLKQMDNVVEGQPGMLADEKTDVYEINPYPQMPQDG